jgi:hypothetical protein
MCMSVFRLSRWLCHGNFFFHFTLVQQMALLCMQLPLTKLVPEAGLLNKSSRLTSALGVTKFITIIAMYLVTLCCAT